MRNLKLLKSRSNGELSHSVGGPQCAAVRSDTDSLLLASQFSIIEFDPRTGQVVNDVSLTEDGYMPGDGSGTVVGIQELAELESVCVATATGDVILYNLTSNEVECVGSVDSGLTSMSWSPDEELVALTTGQQTVIMMTKDFQPITEVGIHQDDFGEGKFITVGWGKKETQFHGSEGKQAAQKKTLGEVQPAVPWDDQRPRVSWRGDGQLFAVGAVCPQSGARRVRVWSREGVLQATSEAVNGLEQALCWKPSGSLIACTQRHPNKHSVVFMEKNGLLHGDFTLPCGRDQVKELLWNSDSTVLAVWLEDMTPGDDGLVSTQLQLWTVMNYHWYMKQSLPFGRDPERAPACVLWDPQRPLRLHVVTRGWACLAYDWGWATDRSAGLDAGDNANVAVIDGDKILVTTFRQGVVPPPMCSYDLQLTSPVNLVTFLYSGTPSGERPGGFRVISRPLVLRDTYSVAGLPEAPLAIRQLLWLKEDLLLGLSSGTLPSSSTLLFLSPAPQREVQIDGVVTSMAYIAHSGTVALQLEDGQTRKLIWDSDSPSVVDWTDPSGYPINFPVPCVQTALCTVSGEEVLLGLTDRCHLYAGDTQLASNVSSFVVYDDFLLVTTHAHTCRCLHLGLQEALGSDGGQNDETLRRVERGSRIVTVVPQDTRLILQMPRGNLETVHHRALVLAQIRKQLDSKLRINLNFIYDHNPQVFLDNVEAFITQLKSVNHINLFLTELREEDTTTTMYPCPPRVPPMSRPTGARKVDVVCDALRNTLESLDPDNYCLSILTSHVKKTVPELEIALQKVHDLRAKPPGAAGSVVGAEEALKYLLFLVNVNDLYDHSLGTYDFDLVLMVAEKSQKDPKEYLPFLNNLKTMEPNYQRYTIDKHLKRYTKALQHLSKCGVEHFPEALGLVRDQKLFSEALELYPADSPQYKALSCAYAEHLAAQQQPEQAGLLLWRCGEPGHALGAFVAASSWRHALCVAQQLALPPDQLALLRLVIQAVWASRGAQSHVVFLYLLLGKLIDQRRYSEAALLLDQYAKDCEEAISALIKGADWEEALRLAYRHSRQDIIETDLKPALLEAFASHSSFLTSHMALFRRHRERLSVVLQLKEKARMDMLDDDGPDCPDSELYSEASSVMTNSKRSAKNRRKAERKRWSLKEGSALEDIALLHALADIVGAVDKLREELHSLLKALVLFQYDKQAQKLQLAYDEALLMLQVAIPEVWQEAALQTQAPITGPDSTANSITASLQQQQRPAAATLQLPDAEVTTVPKMRSSVKWKLMMLK
ncbi:hypothetical protein NHX12_011746 [Muraenolepis orangiensis]|uniref:Elongator complex protein 1 n=1 Tax=Muraenolepis orangiensis TaxID=630683 RepID=A0A9Q0DID6_9TELE|nr:hypothetical protein NHX12_011746 [Muraenolepis orangiensis]